MLIIGSDVNVRTVHFPYKIKGVTIPNPNGTFDIYINSLLSQECQQKALKHELKHIKKDHFFNRCCVAINEMVANQAI